MYTENDFRPHCPIILVLDTSHSMWGQGLVDMMQSLQVFYQTLQREEIPESVIDIAAVSMGDNLGMLEEFTPFTQSKLPTMTIRPKGYTPIGAALTLAKTKLQKQLLAYQQRGLSCVRPHVLLLSDGRDSSDDFSAIAAEFRTACQQGELCCWAIALGQQPDLNALRLIAEDAIVQPDCGELKQAFANVGKCVSQIYHGETVDTSAPEPEPQMPYASHVPEGDFAAFLEPYTTGTAAPRPRPRRRPVPRVNNLTSTPPASSNNAPRQQVKPAPRTARLDYILDGSNILGMPASLKNVLAITNELERRRKTYQVFFDASARHKLRGAERDQYEQLLQQRPTLFCQAPARAQADVFILKQAELHPQSRIITNDLYRDYQTAYPGIANSEQRLLKSMLLPGGGIFIPQQNMYCKI